MKLKLLLVLLLLLNTPAWAQKKYDGYWLRKVVQSHQRVTANNSPSMDDVNNAVEISAYIRGFFSAHSQANLLTMILALATASPQSEADKQRMKIAFAYSPLLNIPAELNGEQTVAILNRYLETNPHKWQDDAGALLLEAMKEAFPLRPAKK